MDAISKVSMDEARCALTRVFATWAVLRTHLSVPTDSRLFAALNAVPAHIKARLAQEVENTEAAFDLLGQAVRSARIPDLRQAIYGVFARMMEGLPGPALQPLLCKTAAIFSREAAQDALLHLHFQRGKAMANAILSGLLSAGSALEIRSHYIAGRLPPLKTA